MEFGPDFQLVLINCLDGGVGSQRLLSGHHPLLLTGAEPRRPRTSVFFAMEARNEPKHSIGTPTSRTGDQDLAEDRKPDWIPEFQGKGSCKC